MAKTEVTTEMIIDILKRGEIDLDSDNFPYKLPSLSDCLNEYIGNQELSIQHICDMADINRNSWYKMMNGTMRPSGDVLICLAFAMKLNLPQTQVLLKCGECAALSGHRHRDVIIMDGIINGHLLEEVNEKLLQHGLRPIMRTKL